jgi:hypothetical protein
VRLLVPTLSSGGGGREANNVADSSKEDIPVLWRVNTMEHLDVAQGKAGEVKS